MKFIKCKIKAQLKATFIKTIFPFSEKQNFSKFKVDRTRMGYFIKILKLYIRNTTKEKLIRGTMIGHGNG